MNQYAIVCADPQGSVEVLVGPFDTNEEARKFLDDKEEYFIDLEHDLTNEYYDRVGEPPIRFDFSETYLVALTHPSEMFAEVKP